MTTITKEWLQQTIAEFENTRDDIPFGLSDDDAKILIVLKRALVSLERERIRREHAEWSDATFGDVGPIGPLKHLSKEALETAAEPDDLSEWADMQFLLWDAQRRAGITDEQITRALTEKLAINKTRQWTEPKDGEPRLHIKEQPASVVPDEKRDDDGNTTSEFDYGWNACRAAMLQAGNSPVTPDTWIPVSERMPERDVDVQVYCADTKEQMVGYMERNEAEGWFRFASLPNGGGVYCKPTHWMPLPAAPQQEVK
ncbi:TPA: dATP/dGTP pyrophosphohydrolase domain-containing protein [Salmonella enterica subsp. enterica serovar Newport]